ncbi:hypothetical protein K8O68_05555 [Salipaludibacillus sp. CUR1]|uniref:hypothetical protein n=1 Tax=Salipaludibacillus sp. CUR1 TaxID=2820003 RepID=UPI001E3D21A1|nr:hypothetical protein [Salipaludibacillus sp. CUR1]MCE7791885.1 hypothetical protein [Salipaludibacillus sp. CUR1]
MTADKAHKTYSQKFPEAIADKAAITEMIRIEKFTFPIVITPIPRRTGGLINSAPNKHIIGRREMQN